MWRMTTEIFNHLKEGGNRINKRKWICRIHVTGLGEPGNYFLAAFSSWQMENLPGHLRNSR